MMTDYTGKNTALRFEPSLEGMMKAILSPEPAGRLYTAEWLQQTDLDGVQGTAFALIPLLYQRTRLYGITDRNSGRLKGIYRYTLYKNNLLLHQVFKVMEEFFRAGIEVMAVGETAFVIRYYQDPGLRLLRSADIFMDRSHIPAAANILQQHRWIGPSSADMERALSALSSIHFDKENGLRINVHCDMGDFKREDGSGGIGDSSEEMDFNGLPLSVLNPGDLILNHCREGKWNNLSLLRMIVDIYILLEKRPGNIDWRQLIRTAESAQVTLILNNCLSCIHSFCDNLISDEIFASLAANRVTREEEKVYKLLFRQSSLAHLKLQWMHHVQCHPERSLPGSLITFPDHLKNRRSLQG